MDVVQTTDPADDAAHDTEAPRRTAYEAFAQDHYYLDAWEGLLNGNSKRSGFNWYAACFGMAWCFFRKMYLVGAVVLMLTLFVASVFGILYLLYFGEGGPSDQDAPSDLQLNVLFFFVLFPTVRVPLGFLANKLYFNKGTGAIEKIVESGLNGNEAIKRIRSMGGTSQLGLAVAILISFTMRYLGWY